MTPPPPRQTFYSQTFKKIWDIIPEPVQYYIPSSDTVYKTLAFGGILTAAVFGATNLGYTVKNNNNLTPTDTSNCLSSILNFNGHNQNFERYCPKSDKTPFYEIDVDVEEPRPFIYLQLNCDKYRTHAGFYQYRYEFEDRNETRYGPSSVQRGLINYETGKPQCLHTQCVESGYRGKPYKGTKETVTDFCPNDINPNLSVVANYESNEKDKGEDLKIYAKKLKKEELKMIMKNAVKTTMPRGKKKKN